MKTVVYLSSVLLLLSSCITSKEFYDDVYDSAEKPSAAVINPGTGYADYIKEAEDDNQVVIDKFTLRPEFRGIYNEKVFSELGDGCACDCNFIPNSVFYDLSGMTQRLILLNEDEFFGDCECCRDIFVRRYNSYAMYYTTGFGSIGRYDIWGYSYYPTNAFGYDYNWMCMHNVDPYFYGGNPYYAYNSNYWNGWNYGTGYGWGYWGNGWGNSNGWFVSNSGGDESGNHHYGHHGHTYTGSSNTTGYMHTVKENETIVVTGNNSDSHLNTATGITFAEVKPVTTTGVDNIVVATNNQPTGKEIKNVPATNQFATGVAKTNTGGTSNNTAVNPQGNNRPAGTSANTTDYVNEYERYVEPTSSGNTSSNSTSRNSGTTYDNSKTTYRPSNYESGSGSGSNTSYGHRTSTSGGSGSSTGSTSGGSRSTSTSRR